MTDSLRREIEVLIKDLKLDCTIEEFKDKVNWNGISTYQNLSEEFIKEFKNKVNWNGISSHQTLSGEFIEEFKDRLDWNYISEYQKLSEKFIKEFKNKVNWNYISAFQKLSGEFIREFKDKVNWYCISEYQILSESFIREFHDKIDINLYIKKHRILTEEEKKESIKEYAEKYDLKFDGEYLYAFRNHDKYGRGMWNSTIFYSPGNYYRDWHLDMDATVEDSYGLGIWPEGNTHIKVHKSDWGIEVNREDGKARVWGFTVI